MWPILLVQISLFVTAMLMLVRNELVYREKSRVLDIVSDLAQKDQTEDWRWRYDAYREVTYRAMMCKFWKPVKSFYKDHRCLRDVI